MTSVTQIVVQERGIAEVWLKKEYQELKAFLCNLPFRILDDIYDQIQPEKVSSRCELRRKFIGWRH
jgi:hypothetical protein